MSPTIRELVFFPPKSSILSLIQKDIRVIALKVVNNETLSKAEQDRLLAYRNSESLVNDICRKMNGR